MGVHVDEAWADDAAAYVNDSPGLHVGFAGADDGYAIAADANAAAKPGLSRAVDDASVAQENIEHGALPLGVPESVSNRLPQQRFKVRRTLSRAGWLRLLSESG